MADQPPSGMLSFTYHLAYDDYYRGLWLKNQYDEVLDDFDIDPAIRPQVINLSKNLGSPNAAARNSLTDQWMALVTADLKGSESDPNVLW